MQLEAHLIPFAQTMILIVGGFIFIQSILLTVGSILRSHGYTRDMLYVTIIMNVFNASGNAIVIFGLFGLPILGVPGVAVVTVISKLVGLEASSCYSDGVLEFGKKWVQLMTTIYD